MYTTEQFDKDVEGLRALIKMCDDFEKEENEKADRLSLYTHLTLPTILLV